MHDRLNQNVIHLLNQRTRLIAKEMNQRLKTHELYSSQWSIIYCIDRFGPMTQTEIWKYLNVEAPTVTRTLSRMEKNGWITRVEGNDKRERVIELTLFAKQKRSSIRQTIDQLEYDLLADLSVEEKEHLHILLGKINTSGENAN